MVPVVEAITFWILLRKPQPAYNLDYVLSSITDDAEKSLTSDIAKDNYMHNHIILQPNDNATNNNPKTDDEESFGFIEKLKYFPSLAKYTVPLALVYFLEFLINQGMVSSFTRCTFHKSLCDVNALMVVILNKAKKTFESD